MRDKDLQELARAGLLSEFGLLRRDSRRDSDGPQVLSCEPEVSRKPYYPLGRVWILVSVSRDAEDHVDRRLYSRAGRPC